jgi:hypothetical protein
MGQLEDLMARRNAVAANIEKACNTGFDLNQELEKARSGVYADTAENRKMNRVGQKYGSEKKEEEPKGQKEKKQEEEGSGKTVSEHAAGASDEALKRAAADKKASPEVKAAAEEEMKKRGSNEDKEKLAKEFIENAKKEFEKKFPGMKFDINPSAKSVEDSKEDEAKEEDFEDISTDIDSIAYHMADNPKQDESGNKIAYKDGDIQEKIVEEHGVKIRKLVEKYGKGETISMISKNSDTFDRIRARRLVNACLTSK